MATGRICIIYPNGLREFRTITNKKGPQMEDLQKAIGGGYFERVRVRYDGRMRDAYVDEDGLSKRLPLNTLASELLGASIVGPMAIWIPDQKGKKNDEAV